MFARVLHTHAPFMHTGLRHAYTQAPHALHFQQHFERNLRLNTRHASPNYNKLNCMALPLPHAFQQERPLRRSLWCSEKCMGDTLRLHAHAQYTFTTWEKRKKNEFLQNLVSENGEARDQFFHQWQTQILPENYNHTESLLNTQSFVIPCRVTHENDAQATWCTYMRSRSFSVYMFFRQNLFTFRATISMFTKETETC